jgi:hypothetical protein
MASFQFHTRIPTLLIISYLSLQINDLDANTQRRSLYLWRPTLNPTHGLQAFSMDGSCIYNSMKPLIHKIVIYQNHTWGHMHFQLTWFFHSWIGSHTGNAYNFAHTLNWTLGLNHIFGTCNARWSVYMRSSITFHKGDDPVRLIPGDPTEGEDRSYSSTSECNVHISPRVFEPN